MTSGAERYPASLRILHWLMALCIFGLIALGIYMTPFESRPPKASDDLYFWHKSFGLLVLFLVPIRLALRLRARAAIPALPAGLARAERCLAKGVKILMYCLMFAVPAIGYLHSSAYPFSSGVHFFVIDLPDLVHKDAGLASTTVRLHKVLAYSLAALAGLHVLGALKHRFMDRENDVLGRML